MVARRRRSLAFFAAHAAAGALTMLLAACTLHDVARRDSTAVSQQASASRTWNPATWQPPVVDSTPDDPVELAVYRGLAIMTHTRDSLPGYVGANLSCTSCHLDEGRRPDAARLAGVMARYPKYMDRTGAVVPIEDRVNYCFTRSLAGSRLPPDSREMQDIVAYLAFISRGVPTGDHVPGEGMPAMPPHVGDSTRGRVLFAENCARCHGEDGSGMGPIPAVWGPRSFSVGASMARQERAASFIRHNMPFDRPGILTDQQAFDIAAYITSMPRPDSPGKENDWPNGDAPADVPYATKGHAAFRPPHVLPRTTDRAGAIVMPPLSVLHRR